MNDVKGAVSCAVHRALFVEVESNVYDAVGYAVGGAVRGAVGGAVDRAVWGEVVGAVWDAVNGILKELE